MWPTAPAKGTCHLCPPPPAVSLCCSSPALFCRNHPLQSSFLLSKRQHIPRSESLAHKATQPARARSCLKVGVNHLPVHKCPEHLPLLMLPELFYIHVVLTPKECRSVIKQNSDSGQIHSLVQPANTEHLLGKHAPMPAFLARLCCGPQIRWWWGGLNARIRTGREPGKLLEKSDPERSKASISDFYLSRQVLFL